MSMASRASHCDHDFSMAGLVDRFTEIVLDMVGMMFAWSAYYSSLWWIGMARPDHSDMMLVKLAAALTGSLGSFVIIYILDKLADLPQTNDCHDKAIRKCIEFIGVMIGFSWEQAFDVATDDLAQASGQASRQHYVKLAISLFCAVIIVPAWRWWLLPMLEEGGWEYGFVLKRDHTSLVEVWSKVLKDPKFKGEWTTEEGHREFKPGILQLLKEIKENNKLPTGCWSTPSISQEEARQSKEAALKVEMMLPLLQGGPVPGSDNEAEELRRRNEELQQEYDQLYKEYHDHMSTMGEHMKKLESKLEGRSRGNTTWSQPG
jgi:hypothetical protein